MKIRKTKNTNYLLALFLIILTTAASFNVCAEADSNAALIMVTKQGLGNNLTNLAFAAALHTTAYAIVAEQLGVAESRAMVKSELDRLAQKYQERWNKNLALSYSEFLSSEEMSSIATEGRSSKYIANLTSKQAEIGTSMQEKSKPILVEYLSETMTNVYKKAFGAK